MSPQYSSNCRESSNSSVSSPSAYLHLLYRHPLHCSHDLSPHDGYRRSRQLGHVLFPRSGFMEILTTFDGNYHFPPASSRMACSVEIPSAGTFRAKSLRGIWRRRRSRIRGGMTCWLQSERVDRGSCRRCDEVSDLPCCADSVICIACCEPVSFCACLP